MLDWRPGQAYEKQDSYERYDGNKPCQEFLELIADSATL